MLAVAGLALAGLATGLVFAFSDSGGDAARPRAAPACSGTVTVTVDAAPAIAGPVADIAGKWTATHPAVSGRCVEVVVGGVSSVSDEQSLSDPGASYPSLWIPDTSLLTAGLTADRAGAVTDMGAMRVDPSLASSPLVLVAPPQRAQTLGDTAADWHSLIAGTTPFALPDPTVSSEGIMALVAMRDVQGGTARDGGGLMVRLRGSLVAGPAEDLARRLSSTRLAVATEQAVIATNRAHQSLVAVALYPSEGTLRMDYPAVRLSRPSDDPDVAPATDMFEQQLRTQAARAAFSAAGLRDPAGDPVPGTGAATGVAAAAVSALAPLAASAAVDTLRLWTALTRPARTLAVIDVSGSMNDSAGNGQPKIALAAAAVRESVDFYPDGSQLGLWAFSMQQTPTTDWAELVAVGPLSGSVAGTSRRQALLNAANGLPGRVHGDTALYDTTLAAYQRMRAGYDPTMDNSLVILTDGENTTGRSLPQLLAALGPLVDAGYPIPITTIAIGNQVDLGALQQISKATGGRTYAVKQAADIRTVFLDAVIDDV